MIVSTPRTGQGMGTCPSGNAVHVVAVSAGTTTATTPQWIAVVAMIVWGNVWYAFVKLWVNFVVPFGLALPHDAQQR